MKRFFLTLIVLFSAFCFSSCILMSDAYYKTKQAEWEAKKAESIAWSQRSNTLASFTTSSGETFVVNNPNQLKPIGIKEEPNAWVQGTNTILNSSVAKLLGGGWAAGYMLGKVQGDTSYSNGGDGSFNVTNDSNNSSVVDLESNVVDDGANFANNNGAVENRDGANWTDQTSDPVVVEQPAPVIVEQPAPVVVEQPPYNDPIIVEQPPYNDPIIVNQP